jgi:hypothetical protein
MEKQSSSPPPGNPFVETASGHSCSWAKPIPLARLLAALALSLGMSSPAKAVDGCLVLLCFAAPSWRAIGQCVPPIQEVLRDLARGRPFPSCGMSGAGNSAANRRSSAPGYCPPQYMDAVVSESGPFYYCRYDGAVSVTIDGSLWSRTWWSMRGDSVTEFSAAAKASMGTWDTRFDDEFAAWLAVQPPILAEACPPSC